MHDEIRTERSKGLVLGTALEELEKTTEIAYKESIALSERLAPIMRPVEPEPESDAQRRESGGSDVTRQIRERTRMVERIYQTLRTLNGNLDL